MFSVKDWSYRKKIPKKSYQWLTQERHEKIEFEN